MCGILGYTHFRRKHPAGVVQAALESIEHRGPDQRGYYSSDQVTVGNTRLRILDLNGGDQPLFSPDRDVVLVFNGEIFNHRELTAVLVAEGHRFQTGCDTEVVLNAFLSWGTSCFARFRGMFAVAIWIQSEGRLILARDRMGIKPLYYCHQGGEIYFGSELKAIFVHPEVRRNLSLDGLNAFLTVNYVPGPNTLVDGIKKLMPGHMLEWKRGCIAIEPHSKANTRSAPKSDDEACEELDHLIADSVREQLVSDVPVGVWLSGGLDSSTILHYAAEAGAPDLNTFSVTFRGREFDESRFIREVSQHYGTNHSEIDLTDDADLEGAIEQIAYYSDEPSADAGAIPLWFLAKLTAGKVTVALSGEGADELFAGYLTYQADRYATVARRIPESLRRTALAFAQFLPVSDKKISFEYKLKRFLRGALLSPEIAHVYWNGTFSEDEKERFFRFADPAPMMSILGEMKGGSGLSRFLEFDQRYYLPDDILYKVDRISMAHSIEVRPPFLDPRIVDFAAALPDGLKLRGSESKHLLRRLMDGRLPSSVLTRPKIGFDIPIHEWLRGALRQLLLDTLSEAAIERVGLFHWPAISQMLNDHLERRVNLGYHLWGLVVLLLWMRKWGIEPPVVEELITAGSQISDQSVGQYSTQSA
jgi:asparagine synthase (glutamine-hydrolysing)